MKKNTKKEMKRLSRAELLEIIYEMKKNEVKLQQELDEARAQLEKREILINESGSIAEASLAVSDIFAAAQKAADIYLASVKAKYEETEKDEEDEEEEKEEERTETGDENED